MYKVFFKDSTVFLTDDKEVLKKADTSILHKDKVTTQAKILEFINCVDKSDKSQTLAIYSKDLKSLFHIFCSTFTFVEAAGGLVINNNKALIIDRLGHKDLPKGHIEKGETIEECAKREVEEECGIKNVKIERPLKLTFHIYFRNGKWFLKCCFWFLMSCPDKQNLMPQKEEGIEDVYWLNVEKLNTIYNLCFPSIKEVLKTQNY